MLRMSNAMRQTWLLLCALPALAVACPETLPDGMLCKRVAIASSVPKLVSQMVEVNYFSHLKCSVCQALAKLYPAWTQQLAPEVGVSLQHAYFGADSEQGRRDLESEMSSSTLSRATDPYLVYTLKLTGMKDLDSLFLFASDAGPEKNIWARSTAVIGIPDATLRLAALSESVQKAVKDGADLSRLAGLGTVPAFLIDRRFVVELDHDSNVADASDVTRLNGMLAVVKEISQSVAAASPQTRSVVALFSDWNSLAMDQKRSSCDRAAKLIEQKDPGKDPELRFESPSRYLECTLLASPVSILLVAGWQCGYARVVKEDQPMQALDAAKFCAWLVWHGQRSVEFVRRTYGPAEMAAYGEAIGSLQADATKLVKDLDAVVGKFTQQSPSFEKRVRDLSETHSQFCSVTSKILASMSTKQAYSKFMVDTANIQSVKSCAAVGVDIFEDAGRVIKTQIAQ